MTTDTQRIEQLFDKITPRFWYTNRNNWGGLWYFTCMTVEQYDQVYEYQTEDMRRWMRRTPNTDLNIVPIVREMPGTLLHGWRRDEGFGRGFDIQIEGAFVPEEFGVAFQTTIKTLKKKNRNIGLPDEWNLGWLFHYRNQDNELIQTDHVSDYERYRSFWQAGFPWSSETKEPEISSLYEYQVYFMEHPRVVPTVTPDTTKYYRAWWD